MRDLSSIPGVRLRPMTLTHPGGPVFSLARQTIDAFLNNLINPDASVETTLLAGFDLTRAGEDVLGALAERFDDPDPVIKIVAAWTMYGVAREHPTRIPAPLAAQAELILNHVLRDGEADMRALTCLLFTRRSGPPSTTLLLRDLISTKSLVTLPAVAALATMGDRSEHLHSIASETLEHGSRTEHLLALHTLWKLGEPDTKTARLMARLLRGASLPEKRMILQQILLMGPHAAASTPAVERLSSDSRQAIEIRALATQVLGTINPNSIKAHKPLLARLRNKRPEIVVGAIRGLMAAKKISPSSAEQLLRSLSSKHCSVRVAAALAIESLGPDQVDALDAVIRRLVKVTTGQDAESLARVLSSIGVASIPRLVNVLKTHDIRVLPTMGLAIRRMGPDAVVALADHLLVETDEWVFSVLLVLVRDLGPEAAPAVPQLTTLLERTDDEATVLIAAAALSVCGRAGVVAVPSLLRWLISGSDELVETVERVIWGLGPEALPAITSALAGAEGPAQSRLSRVLSGMRTLDDPRFVRVRRIKSETDLQVFVHFVEAADSGTPVSYRAIAKEFKRRRALGLIPDNLPVTNVSISTAVKKISGQVGFDAPNSTHGRLGVISPEARAFYIEAKDYLAVHAAKRGQVHTNLTQGSSSATKTDS